MAWRRRMLVGVGVVGVFLVIPAVIGDWLIAEHGKHWWTNAVKMGPVFAAASFYGNRWLHEPPKPPVVERQPD